MCLLLIAATSWLSTVAVRLDSLGRNYVIKIKQNPDKIEGIVQSLSNPIPLITLDNCPVCFKNENLNVVVNYLVEDPVEYFAFVICSNCRVESDGSSIFYDYRKAVLSAQEFWNTEVTERSDG
jgi:hypothetical protein